MAHEQLDGLLAACGLIRRGGFTPGPEDGLPDKGASLILIGNDGPALWRVFSAQAGQRPNPLNDWSRGNLERIAAELGAIAYFPFGGPPHLPFQKWAMKAEKLHASPIRTLLHPSFGLWHSYRGALLFAQPQELDPMEDWASPCATCSDRPCLNSCPVEAWSGGNLDIGTCMAGLDSPEGSDCMGGGCLARRACPVGRDHIYAPEQASFHMRAFLEMLHARFAPDIA